MFTGIVTEIGRIAVRKPLSGGVEFTIEARATTSKLSIGASVAVNGVCQTVVHLTESTFTVQAVGATLDRTTFGELAEGSRVNLEPSLRVGDEIGGHLVMGHVDGVGRVAQITKRDDAVFLTVTLPEGIERFAAPRGSLALDGTSLTIAAAEEDRVTFSIIPHTLAQTIAGGYRAGDAVNLEVDLMARYLDRLLAGRTAEKRESLTLEILKEKFS